MKIGNQASTSLPNLPQVLETKPPNPAGNGTMEEWQLSMEENEEVTSSKSEPTHLGRSQRAGCQRHLV